MRIRAGVAAGHPATAAAGAEILRAGGSAADAAVAAMLVGCAAESIFNGLSGGGFATYYDAADGTVTCVDFFVAVPGLGGRTPGPGTPIEVRFVGQDMPYDVGPPTVAVPGNTAGAHHVWSRWGRLDWPQVVEPGRRASFGTPFPAAHAKLLPAVAQAMCVGEGARMFCDEAGHPLPAGAPLFHPDLHRAYELLARDPEALYRGELADALVDAVADGGALDHTDLEAYRVVEHPGRSVDLYAGTVHARGDDLDDVLGTLARAAAAVGADPLLDADAARGLVAALRGPERRAETTNLVAVDADGNACAMTTSLGLGSAVWVPGYGVHLNSMMGEGELIRSALPPGARMGSMMSPLVVLDAAGAPVLAAGAAGGSRIRPALVQTVLRMLAGADPQSAIDAPRLNAMEGRVRLEPGFAADVLHGLAADGEEVLVADGRDPYFGGVSAISRLGGGADPRRSGAVVMLDD
ncbi:gamma-glutamyltranspeptidase/glutathione hydrolase [Friedmanniella endophytica]|uniref:Gamma-glutamyltranspeptidase/glutathione hydrolase n=1 Tax=Microlunatus kandeliicorticis TaxID=1759536 RepID=A0A7W3IPZ5_9ACTN|nr:gamma-glutamyltransferase [Microlunatus kandeliicorticis]MBA8793090.1 gamma-glutamyltranspeptidase/glutathione hydrolase [Microlunatus kandeliicorticis]